MTEAILRHEAEALAARALAHWPLPDARLTLAAQRENLVWRVESGGRSHALRYHRPGLRSVAEIVSELDFMAALSAGGLSVPAPLPTREGRLWVALDGAVFDVLEWVPGLVLQPDTPVANRVAATRALGAAMARLHRIADAWQPPVAFSRPAWDAEGLTGAAPLWGPHWAHPHLSADQRDLLLRASANARRALDGADHDYGLIHADLVVENVLFDGAAPWLIDFDDFGHGYRLFELATVLLRAQRDPDYPAVRGALLDSYLGARPLDLEALDLFVALRSFTYVGWIVPRLDEPGARERSARFIARACRLAETLV